MLLLYGGACCGRLRVPANPRRASPVGGGGLASSEVAQHGRTRVAELLHYLDHDLCLTVV